MLACALCGTASPPPFRAPPPEGAPDLDGRPGEPTRSTLARWVLRCAHCGACAPDLSVLPPGGVPDRAERSRFLRWAALVRGTPAEAEALLQAAWEAEDAGADGAALRQRSLAALPPTAEPQEILRRADIARRAGDFPAAAALLAGLPASTDDTVNRVSAFLHARVAAQDRGRHLMSSALRPPARTPHVTHGQRSSGLLARLFGTGRR